MLLAAHPVTSSRPDPQDVPSAQESAGPDASASSPPPAKATEKKPDPLRGSRTSGFWTAVIVLAVLLLLLAIFILQNTQSVRISFLGFDGHAPLAAALLIATVAGAFVVACAGALRILQLRRRVKRERKRAA
jgi:uncharacterized integral membrane protein